MPSIPGGIDIVFQTDTNSTITLQDLLYKELRCNLLHEAVMPSNVSFSATKLVNGKPVAELHVGTPMKLPDFWVWNLAIAVADAPENAAECKNLFPHKTPKTP